MQPRVVRGKSHVDSKDREKETKGEMVIDVVNSSLSRIVEPYRKWITANPQLLADIESTIRCLSYFTAGHFNNSSFAAELIYSMPNLLILFNDLLMYSGKCMHLKLHEFESKIKIWLTVVEYTETLFEVSAKKLWGESGKWLVIAFIQIFKTILRLLLVHVYQERVTKSPPIQPLNREKLNVPNEEKTQTKEGFTLKRSGTIVRSVKSTSTLEMRSWEPLTLHMDDKSNVNSTLSSEKNLMLAESLYVVKPLFHLGCMSITGDKQWPPWVLSFLIDIISLKIYSNEARLVPFSKEDRKEFLRRRLGLLLYILRSPFYDKYSRVRIHATLNLLSQKVPFARLLAEPIKKYLPRWQSMYFYMWSS